MTSLIIVSADNIVYETGGVNLNHESTLCALEARRHQAPVVSASLTMNTESEHEDIGSGLIYNMPVIYEYATIGPNEEMVKYFVIILVNMHHHLSHVCH